MTRLQAIVERSSGRRVAVVGDVMLDHFLIGHVDRISPEAPVPVVRFDRKGVVSSTVIAAAVGTASEHRKLLLVDPKVPQAERYRGVTLVTPNHHEAELMTATSIRSADDARRAARAIHERCGASVLITL